MVGKVGIGVNPESKSNRVSGDDLPVFCDPCLRVLRFQRQLCGNADQRKALATCRQKQPDKFKAMMRIMRPTNYPMQPVSCSMPGALNQRRTMATSFAQALTITSGSKIVSVACGSACGNGFSITW